MQKKKQMQLYRETLRSNLTSCHEKYKQYRNLFQRIKRHAKRTYYQNKCVEFKNDTKKLWSIINNVVKTKHDKSNVIDYLKNNSVIERNPDKIAEQFGKYFSNVGEQFALKIGNPKKTVVDYTKLIKNNPKSVYLTPCTQSEILKIIESLPNKTSSGYDDITNILLKKIKLSVIEPLELIFNASLNTGEFPDRMKQADVVPLYKSGLRCQCTNYRPISLLLTTSKLLEKVMYK